jgi:hypothetical protein
MERVEVRGRLGRRWKCGQLARHNILSGRFGVYHSEIFRRYSVAGDTVMLVDVPYTYIIGLFWRLSRGVSRVFFVGFRIPLRW